LLLLLLLLVLPLMSTLLQFVFSCFFSFHFVHIVLFSSFFLD